MFPEKCLSNVARTMNRDNFQDMFMQAATSPQAKMMLQKAMQNPKLREKFNTYKSKAESYAQSPTMQKIMASDCAKEIVREAKNKANQFKETSYTMVAPASQNMVAPKSYTAGQPMIGSLDVCPPPKASYTEGELLAVFPKGVMSESLAIDQQTGRVLPSQLAAYVSQLQEKEDGPIPKHPEQHIAGDNSSSSIVNEKIMEKVVASDASVFNNMKAEYCFYEQRYRYALKTFLQLATSRDTKDNPAAQRMLQHTKKLNMRLNSVLEVMNYLTQQRVGEANANKDSINKANIEINKALDKLQNTYTKLSKDNAILTTQKEMVRYTQEKNNYTTNQISLWAALNVLALGTIFYVYRN